MARGDREKTQVANRPQRASFARSADISPHKDRGSLRQGEPAARYEADGIERRRLRGCRGDETESDKVITRRERSPEVQVSFATTLRPNLLEPNWSWKPAEGRSKVCLRPRADFDEASHGLLSYHPAPAGKESTGAKECGEGVGLGEVRKMFGSCRGWREVTVADIVSHANARSVTPFEQRHRGGWDPNTDAIRRPGPFAIPHYVPRRNVLSFNVCCGFVREVRDDWGHRGGGHRRCWRCCRIWRDLLDLFWLNTRSRNKINVDGVRPGCVGRFKVTKFQCLDKVSVPQPACALTIGVSDEDVDVGLGELGDTEPLQTTPEIGAADEPVVVGIEQAEDVQRHKTTSVHRPTHRSKASAGRVQLRGSFEADSWGDARALLPRYLWPTPARPHLVVPHGPLCRRSWAESAE
mmetsp:Transcript_53487/g.116194  ORF Transcript_53487/g.116194 Transcript_53487/m.116194 type:complete len:409 (+) Transcript_53487:109-1335(+)